MKSACPECTFHSGTAFGCRRQRLTISSPSLTLCWSIPWPMQPCASASSSLVTSSQRARSRRPRGSRPFTNQSLRNGGRSCKRPTSSPSNAPPLPLPDALARVPKLLGRCRHFKLRARFPGYRIGDRVHQRGDRGCCARLSFPLYSPRVPPRRNKVPLLVTRYAVIAPRQL